jgi:Zinc knuckle
VIKNQLFRIDFNSLTSMSTRCALIDQNLQERDKRQGRNRNSTQTPNNSNVNPNPNRSFRTYRNNDNNTQKDVKEEPTEKTSWKTNKSQTTSTDLDRDRYMKEGRCFNCHQVGHQSRDCLKKQIVNSVTDENKEKKKGYSTSASDSDDSQNRELSLKTQMRE